MNLSIVKNGKYLLLFSGILLILGLVSLFTWKLKFGIDFIGGTVLTYNSGKVNQADVLKGVDQNKYNPIQVHDTGNGSYSITTKPLTQDELKTLEDSLNKNLNSTSPLTVNTIGPVIGDELKLNAIKAIVIVSICIIIYIAFAFRNVSKPVSSWIYGLMAVIAMVHDVLIVLGAFALLGHLFDATIDSLFVTAILTVIGFSVHDTIVVFDRIRENLVKNSGMSFEEVVNNSLLETLGRSINTSLTVILTLLSLFLLGGVTIRWFVLALLVGITSGTYSSIFVASQLLVLYNNYKNRKK